MRADKHFFRFIFGGLVGALVVGCGGKDSSFSLLSDSDAFQQTEGTVNTKVDILWVIDNSGSMQSSQENVTNNLSAFIDDFATKGLNFKMAVTATDAWRTIFTGNNNCARFRDGILNQFCNTVTGRSYSGIRVIDFLTANIPGVFMTNARLTDFNAGIAGSGDERAFQSMKTALDLPLNAGFLREDSFLSVIVVSDEDDFSHDGSYPIGDVNDPNLHTVQSYIDYLDGLTGSTPTNRRYNVNAMAIYDSQCLSALQNNAQRISVRYGQMVDAVNAAFAIPESRGVKSSLCGDFGEELKNIASGILTLANRFTLARIPVPESISVVVNGVAVPQRDTNPLGDGGWLYEAATNSILFIGQAYIPPAGSSIKVNYDPVSYGQ